jgi:hypothetical protein
VKTKGLDQMTLRGGGHAPCHTAEKAWNTGDAVEDAPRGNTTDKTFHQGIEKGGSKNDYPKRQELPLAG